MTTVSEINTDTLRRQTAEIARSHKASWIKLGQFLYTIHRDKLYREWDYLSFEIYCNKELGIKRTTASKLIKSYDYLEKEEPRIVDASYESEEGPERIPNYESVNLLRLAKHNEQITPQEYSDLRHSVIQKAKEPKEVRAQVKNFLDEKVDKTSEAFKAQRRATLVKRLVSSLKNTSRELKEDHLVPNYLLEQIVDLTGKLEDQLES